MDDATEVEKTLRRMAREMADQTSSAQRLAASDPASYSFRSPNGEIRVTVDQLGRLVGLRLSDSAMTLTPAGLSERILECVCDSWTRLFHPETGPTSPDEDILPPPFPD